MGILVALLPTIVDIVSKFFGTDYANLASTSISAIEAIVTELKSGNSSLTSEIAVILSSVESELRAIVGVGGLSTEQDAVASEAIAIIASALTGIQQAESGSDPANLDVPPSIQ